MEEFIVKLNFVYKSKKTKHNWKVVSIEKGLVTIANMNKGCESNKISEDKIELTLKEEKKLKIESLKQQVEEGNLIPNEKQNKAFASGH